MASRKTATKRGTKKVDVPGKPKRPQTSYFLFLAKQRPILVEEGLSSKLILTRAGELWRGLDASEKKIYEDLAKEEKKKYEKAMEKFNKEQASSAKNAKKAKVEAPAKNGAKDSDESEEEEESDE